VSFVVLFFIVKKGDRRRKNWADELLVEYKEGRNALHQMKTNLHEDNFEDETQINSMIESMTFAMDWKKALAYEFYLRYNEEEVCISNKAEFQHLYII